jgi:hypothetical protein
MSFSIREVRAARLRNAARKEPLKEGDCVKVYRSPYHYVIPGTITTIEKVVHNHFGIGAHLYILSDLSNKLFRRSEIRKES